MYQRDNQGRGCIMEVAVESTSTQKRPLRHIAALLLMVLVGNIMTARGNGVDRLEFAVAAFGAWNYNRRTVVTASTMGQDEGISGNHCVNSCSKIDKAVVRRVPKSRP